MFSFRWKFNKTFRYPIRFLSDFFCSVFHTSNEYRVSLPHDNKQTSLSYETSKELYELGEEKKKKKKSDFKRGSPHTAHGQSHTHARVDPRVDTRQASFEGIVDDQSSNKELYTVHIASMRRDEARRNRFLVSRKENSRRTFIERFNGCVSTDPCNSCCTRARVDARARRWVSKRCPRARRP